MRVSSLSHPHPETRDPDQGTGSDADTNRDTDEFDAAGASASASANRKKKRRVVMTSDKKYCCPHLGCGKSYSRAEHLYRHQLNHSPKQIYRCDFPDCDRSFVRADLCARHKERHDAKGSNLQRKGTSHAAQRPTSNASPTTSPTDAPSVSSSSALSAGHYYNQQQHPQTSEAHIPVALPERSYGGVSDHYATVTLGGLAPLNTATGMSGGPPLEPYGGAYTTDMNGPTRPLMSQAGPTAATTTSSGLIYENNTYLTPSGSQVGGGYGQHRARTSLNPMQLPRVSPSQPSAPMYAQQQYPSPISSNQNFRSPTSFSSLPSLPPFGLPPTYGGQQVGPRSVGGFVSPSTTSSLDQHQISNSASYGMTDWGVMDMSSDIAMPVFGNDNTFNRSPTAMVDESFVNMLFNTGGMELDDPSPPEPELEPMRATSPPPLRVSLPKLEPNGTVGDWDPTAPRQGLDIDIREATISEHRHFHLFEVVRRFGEIKHNEGRRSKAEILAGDVNDPQHVMSLQMLKTYVASYWVHIHKQMPILHRPTFSPETCPDLLLLSMICLGATCLEQTHSWTLAQTAAEMAFFIAYHIRWEVFKDAEFRPTARLWTFQSMLLLELFEKMYSTGPLHERAHIHHATTLTVMRRGSSLIGRSAVDSPGGAADPTRTPPGPDGSINASGRNTRDAYWNRWITAEATRRAAFAAFVIDSTHATLFGHSAVMSPHEVRLPLPCDEALWSADSSAEVQRVEAGLAVSGLKPTTFLDGLKRMLNGQKVRTNTFGRVILMAGLLNLSWHMNQRDLQVTSLGAANTLGNEIKWRSPLTHAFDFWRRDFDDSLARSERRAYAAGRINAADHEDNIFESKTCLHSLAHMAMHVDIIDCQVFAGAERALGRLVTESDRAAVQRRMREQWAPSARARDAVYYAIHFLCEVLLPHHHHHQGKPSSSSSAAAVAAASSSSLRGFGPRPPPTFTYSARDDYLLNRPWVLYFSTLIVWAYGYALDGPISPSNFTLTTPGLRAFDLHAYLVRMASVDSPDDFVHLRDRNACLGLLLLLREAFAQPRWELLHEASASLGVCVELLVPGYGKWGGVGVGT